MEFDYIVVGAGFAGSVVARKLAEHEKKILLIEQRNHIGGNSYDYYNEYGIIVHRYGPHIFHTNYENVYNFLSRFTDWIPYQHKVLAYVDGKKIPIPFNLNSLYEVFPPQLAREIEEELTQCGWGRRIPILELKRYKNFEVLFVADYVYKKIFLNYTAKQWGVRPEDLTPEVCARVPVVVSRDNRYFQDKYQGIPKRGYTKIFERMLEHPKIKLLLNTDYKEIVKVDLATGRIQLLGSDFSGKLIYTGPIDYFFDYRYGKLPYRSIDFKFETFVPLKPVKGDQNNPFYQEVAVVNYPNDYEFTRITEFKHFQEHPSPYTTILKEYPEDYIPGRNVPCYPILQETTLQLYKRYEIDTKKLRNTVFLGRLAEYRYYNMDEVIKRALETAEMLLKMNSF